MPSRLAACLVLATLFPLAGCALPGDEAAGADGFRVLRIGGAIHGEGPAREEPAAACGAPVFDASVDFANRTVHAARKGGERPRLVVVEEIAMEDPSASLACGGWPRVHATGEGHLVWRWALHGHAVTLDLDARGERVRVNGRLLAPDGNHTVPVAFEWRDEATGRVYAFRGEIVVADAGAWPADGWREADAAAGLPGTRGVLA